MRTSHWLGITFLFLLLTNCSTALGQTRTTGTQVRPLTNNDVLRMVKRGEKSAQIIAKIVTANCNFDVFPPVLADLKRRGIPDTVLVAMKSAPYGPPSLADVDSKISQLAKLVQIPGGTAIELETVRAISSANAPVGSPITFVATRRVYVDNTLIIERGAVAKARVVKSRRARGWGRPGMLSWELEYVIGVDGTRIPVQLAGQQTGKSRTAAVAGTALATGALIFPYSSPVALIWGLKKGDEAVLRGNNVVSASVKTKTEVAGFQPRPGGPIFHDMETVRASIAPITPTNFERGSFKPKSFKSNQ
ncbi:MAG TPA: hypothetical protein VN843_09895 [Anaerolineales bacterium]|nr:hypothetical protein [Anaerolineales bacterium]